MRADQYAAAKATNTEVSKLIVNEGSVAVSNSNDWPRVIVNVSNPDQTSLPVIAFAVQEDARSQYKLLGWARALGGAQFQLDNMEKGSAPLSADAQGYVKTPKEALQGYVDMLNSGNAGNDQYSGDDFARRYLQDAKSLNDAVQAAGTFKLMLKSRTSSPSLVSSWLTVRHWSLLPSPILKPISVLLLARQCVWEERLQPLLRATMIPLRGRQQRPTLQRSSCTSQSRVLIHR